MNNLSIIVIIDDEIISEHTGRKNIRITREVVEFLENLSEINHIAISPHYDYVFTKLKFTNKFMLPKAETPRETMIDVTSLSRFYGASGVVILIEPNMLKMFIHNSGCVFENIYVCINNLYVSLKGMPQIVDFSRMMIQNKITTNAMTKYTLKIGETFETQYMSLLRRLLKNKHKREGRNSMTLSSFGTTISFDLRRGFPLITTRKMFFRGVVEELLFFIRGDTNSKKLENMGINIWKGNTNREFLDKINLDYEEGIMGPIYGAQWRHFNGKYDKISGKSSGGIDQLKNVVEMIQTDSGSRRIMMTSFNPLQVDDAVLYPCHSVVIQFYVDNDFLDMFAYSRSMDCFHGAPFNIASYSLLLILTAKITGHIARMVTISIGDYHIYTSHIDACIELLNRPLYAPPKLNIEKNILTVEDIENLTFEDFTLVNYKFHEPIKIEMVS